MRFLAEIEAALKQGWYLTPDSDKVYSGTSTDPLDTKSQTLSLKLLEPLSIPVTPD
jgi:hypothetical protein